MIYRLGFGPIVIVFALITVLHQGVAGAQTSFPLYCQGPLTTSAPNPAPTGPTTTAFQWAPTGAGAASPGAGHCAWADRAAGGAEVKSGGGNVICDNVGFFAGIPSGQYWELGVFRDPTSGNCMRITRLVGQVNSPFSSQAALPPDPLPPSFPLYCQGPLTTSAPIPSPSGPTSTPFVWSTTGAGVSSPGPGHCSWADRAAAGAEVKTGGGNIICDTHAIINSLPSGTYWELGVYRDPMANNCMRVTRLVGSVTPPFSATPALPVYVRKGVNTLTPQQIASLQRGIAAMMSRPTLDPTSYRFQANIHGTYDGATTSRELSGWNQCEHGSYFFFSWHRMYLYFFERILRASSGDTNLALPYWNWSDPAQRALPQPFRQPTSGNPLFIPLSYQEPNGTTRTGRSSGVNAGTSLLSSSVVDFSNAFTFTNFDSPQGSPFSFGGQIAPAMQFNGPHGELESQPHDVVHGALGGLMGDPNTAATDPVFWLHHANIDRLWNRWIAEGVGRADPTTDTAWMSTTIFTFWDEYGNAVKMTGKQVIDTASQLGYRYDDDAVPLIHKIAVEKVTKAQAPARAPTVLSAAAPAAARATLTEKSSSINVPLTAESANQLRAELATPTPRRVVLQIDDIRYDQPHGVYYEVYLNVPQGTSPKPTDATFVGNLSFFALMPHQHGAHGTAGPATGGKRDFDITKVAARLQTEGRWNPRTATVTLVPRGLVDSKGQPLTIEAGEKASLGNITIRME